MKKEIDFKSLKFLIIDDMTNMRKTIRNMLQMIEASNISEAENGKQAIAKLHEHGADFIICDWNMPGMSGIELLEIIKNMVEFRTTPFLMITAEMTEDRIAQAAESEVDGYIIKPFVARILEEKIIDILDAKQNPSQETLSIDKALKQMDENKYEEAIKTLSVSLRERPDSARVMHIIGKNYEAMAELDEMKDARDDNIKRAETFYTKAIEANPQYIKVHTALGNFYEKSGDKEMALHSFEEATKLSPNNPDRLMKIGEISLETGQVEKTDKAFKALSAIQSVKKSEALKNMGEAYLKYGHAEKAEKIFKSALAENEDPHLYNRLGIAMRRQGRPMDAIAEYEKAIKISPDDEVLYYNMGKAYIEGGKNFKARECFQKALNIDGDFSEATEELNKL